MYVMKFDVVGDWLLLKQATKMRKGPLWFLPQARNAIYILLLYQLLDLFKVSACKFLFSRECYFNYPWKSI